MQMLVILQIGLLSIISSLATCFTALVWVADPTLELFSFSVCCHVSFLTTTRSWPNWEVEPIRIRSVKPVRSNMEIYLQKPDFFIGNRYTERLNNALLQTKLGVTMATEMSVIPRAPWYFLLDQAKLLLLLSWWCCSGDPSGASLDKASSRWRCTSRSWCWWSCHFLPKERLLFPQYHEIVTLLSSGDDTKHPRELTSKVR